MSKGVSNSWLDLMSRVKDLRCFFVANQIHTIAIYGGGNYGNLLFNDIKKYNVSALYCIDQTVTEFNGIPTVHHSKISEMPDVDCIVICMDPDFEVLKICERSTTFPYIFLRDILNICYIREVIAPYCLEHGLRPYFFSWPWQRCLSNLSDYEKVVSHICYYPEDFRKNPAYLAEIYKEIEEYSDEYIEKVFTLSPTIKKNNTIVHTNISSEYVNVIDGVRFTVGVPEEYDKTVYILGQCMVFGYGVDDNRTIASFLQGKINEVNKNIRIVNYAAWGMSLDNISGYFNRLKSIYPYPGDVVVFFYDLQMYKTNYSYELFYKVLNGEYPLYHSLSVYFDKKIEEGYSVLYFDSTHLSFNGMKLTALYLFDLLQQEDYFHKRKDSHTKRNRAVGDITQISTDGELSNYLIYLEPYIKDAASSAGAIVMNCNPFTLGHRYLIETSAKEVDFLYIFVVEEDRSVFPFKDRLHLVEAGTQDLENVIVLRSGKYIISSLTFPEYFIKDTLKEIIIDPSMDIEIFAKQIAPVLHISKRFVGQEPFDPVTRQYNQMMKNILPKFGVSLIEYERLSDDDSNTAISASRIRALMESGQWDIIKRLVPGTTYDFLQEHYQEVKDNE